MISVEILEKRFSMECAINALKFKIPVDGVIPQLMVSVATLIYN